MEVRAIGKRLRVTPRKARLVARESRGKSAAMAAAELQYHPSKAAHAMRKVLMSAVANALDTGRLDGERLVISRIVVDEGLVMKRIRARAQGRANRILKRTSHITIILGEGEAFEFRKSNANPKPRPKWDTKKKSKKDETKVDAVATEVEGTVEAVEPAAEEIVEAEAPVADTPTEEPEAATEEVIEEPAPAGDEEGKQE
ncbi:MAG: 50S ribosomal protein L22 [Fimbriimonadales bacterium]